MRTVGEAQISLGYIACNSALDPAFFQPVNETRLVAIGGTRILDLFQYNSAVFYKFISEIHIGIDISTGNINTV